jgi:hypothetical protein
VDLFVCYLFVFCLLFVGNMQVNNAKCRVTDAAKGRLTPKSEAILTRPPRAELWKKIPRRGATLLVGAALEMFRERFEVKEQVGACSASNPKSEWPCSRAPRGPHVKSSAKKGLFLFSIRAWDYVIHTPEPIAVPKIPRLGYHFQQRRIGDQSMSIGSS